MSLLEWRLRDNRTRAAMYAWQVGSALLAGEPLPDADSDLRRLARLRREHVRMLFRALSERMYVRAMCARAAGSCSDTGLETATRAAARSG